MSLDWLYDDLGVIACMTELWGLAHHAGVQYARYIEPEEARTEEDDLTILRYLDARAGGRGFAPWRPFAHPQLGPVELGGWAVKFGLLNPPGPLLPALLARAVPFAVAAMGTAPRLRILAAGAERLAAGVYRVWADLGNEGFLPTCGSERGRAAGRGRPLAARLVLPAGALLPGSAAAERELEHLAGRVGHYTAFVPAARYPNLGCGHVEWLVAALPGAALEITVSAEKAGARHAPVVTGA